MRTPLSVRERPTSGDEGDPAQGVREASERGPQPVVRGELASSPPTLPSHLAAPTRASPNTRCKLPSPVAVCQAAVAVCVLPQSPTPRQALQTRPQHSWAPTDFPTLSPRASAAPSDPTSRPVLSRVLSGRGGERELIAAVGEEGDEPSPPFSNFPCSFSTPFLGFLTLWSCRLKTGGRDLES